MTNRQRVITSVALLTILLLLPDLAQAQADGGQARELLNWVVTNIGRLMLNAGILLVAFFLLCARISLGVVGLRCRRAGVRQLCRNRCFLRVLT
jgi:hypothetical protein